MSVSERSYVIYAPTAWHGQFNAAHNFATALANRHRVLYVDPALSPLSPFRYGLRRSSVVQMRALARRRVRAAGPLEVFSPVVLPPIEQPRMRALSRPLLRAQVASAVRQAGLTKPIVLAWHRLPDLRGAADELLRVGVIMDHPSAGAELIGLDPEECERQAAELCAASDVICSTSSATRELLNERGWECELVPFGFPAELRGAFDRAVAPPEYATLPRPLLGYTGGIDDRLDYDLIVKLADRFSEGSLVFVGLMSPRLSSEARAALESRSNIHVVGRRSKEELTGYVRHLDLALLPYKDNLFTRYQSPLKVWEYFYAGPPIVGTGSQALRAYPSPLVNYANDADEAVAMAARALADPSRGRDERQRFALSNTWDDRAKQLDALVAERLSCRRERATSAAA
jgi:teichuronic acid biosynthesis glycosyltransferase TuaH